MAYTFINISQEEELRGKSYWVLWVLGIFVVLVLCLLRWGGYLLVTGNSMPQHADAAVVLQGSAAAENARTDAAMELLQRGAVDRVAISVPKESRWGEDVPTVARPFLEKKYGADLAGKVEFCTTEPDVISPEQEARAFEPCIQEYGWKSLALLTSSYQSRRVELVWRKTLSNAGGAVSVAVEGLPQPDYQPRGWWRQRVYAETWLRESAKLVRASL